MRMTLINLSLFVMILSIAMLSSCSSQTAATGPNGGDIVPIQSGGDGTTAEIVANAETGEIMAHTWNQGLTSRRPIESQSMTLGSGERTIELTPHPLASDPPGWCSRFYGQADWLRGGSIRQGWLRCCAGQGARHDFSWINSWHGGRAHDLMWSDLGEHRRGMGTHVGSDGNRHR